jgi:hypothetical protein
MSFLASRMFCEPVLEPIFQRARTQESQAEEGERTAPENSDGRGMASEGYLPLLYCL